MRHYEAANNSSSMSIITQLVKIHHLNYKVLYKECTCRYLVNDANLPDDDQAIKTCPSYQKPALENQKQHKR